MNDTGRVRGLRHGILTTLEVCCQYDNESSGITRGGEFLYYFSDQSVTTLGALE